MSKIYVKVEPDSSNFEIDFTGTYPKIYLESKPQGGRANKELIDKLSSLLDHNLRIVSGHHSRRKKIQVKGIAKEKVMQRLRDGMKD